MKRVRVSAIQSIPKCGSMQEVGGYGELVWTLIGSAGRIVRVVGSGSEGFVSGTLKHWRWIG